MTTTLEVIIGKNLEMQDKAKDIIMIGDELLEEVGYK